MAGHLVTMAVYGLPDSFFSDFVPKIQAVTAADVQRVANQYVQPDRFAVVVVGDLAKIEAGIRAANLGPVRVVPVDEILK
jgi:zinc protease